MFAFCHDRDRCLFPPNFDGRLLETVDKCSQLTRVGVAGSVFLIQEDVDPAASVKADAEAVQKALDATKAAETKAAERKEKDTAKKEKAETEVSLHMICASCSNRLTRCARQQLLKKQRKRQTQKRRRPRCVLP